MAWLYVPDMEGLSSELNECFLNTDPFVMWRGNVLSSITLLKKFKKEKWMMRLSGLTLLPLMAQSGVERWILSVEDSPASPSHMLENRREQMTAGTYGLQSIESLARFDPVTYSLKTFQASLNMQCLKFSQTFSNWGMMRGGVYSELAMLWHPIEEVDGSYGLKFATQTVIDSRNLPMKKITRDSLKKGLWRGVNLKDSAKLIPTPNASDGIRTNLKHQGGNLKLRGHVMNLIPTPTVSSGAQTKENPTPNQTGGTTLKGWVKMFPTPTVIDSTSPTPSKKVLNSLSKNQTASLRLKEACKLYPTPTVQESKEYSQKFSTISKRGEKRMQETLTRKVSLEESLSITGKLNPQWVAWLMGLPSGWINLDYSEME